jgi:hypothetical protein
VPGSALDGAFPTGPPPALPYLDGKQLISHDRAPVDLPQAYDSFTMVGDRFVGIYSDVNGERMVDIVEGDGSVSLTEPVEGGLALSDIGTTVAYGTPAGTIETVWADDQVQLANNLGEPVSVAAVVGNGSCHEVDGGCRVFFNSNTGGTPRAADSHGIVDEFMKGALKVNDISPTGLIAVMTSAADETSCSGVYNEQHQRFVFKTCDNTLQTFSPDGGRLLAGPDYLDGIGDGSLAILDTATGDPVAQFEIDGGYIAGAQWEDDDHALVIVHTDDVGWRILRVGVDGSVEMAAGPKVTVDDTQRPYFLPS